MVYVIKNFVYKNHVTNCLLIFINISFYIYFLNGNILLMIFQSQKFFQLEQIENIIENNHFPASTVCFIDKRRFCVWKHSV